MKRQCEAWKCEQTATARVTWGAVGPFYFCSDCASQVRDRLGVKIERLVDPNAPTEPGLSYAEPKCAQCGALSYASEEPGWRVCANLHRFEVDSTEEPV
jgi:hypothetical protein